MSDLTARAIADLKAELAESKAAANRVTESMGSEIMRLTAELEQQRTRAEAAEAELRELRKLVDAWKAAHDESMSTGLAVDAAAFYAAEEALRHA